MIFPQIAQISRIMETRDAETYAVIGAAMAVHGELGYGFLESVYAEALAIELDQRQIRYQREHAIHVHYKTQQLKSMFRADFICHGNLLLELKAVTKLNRQAEAQLLHYLKACKLKKGLLLNFGAPSLQYKRFVL